MERYDRVQDSEGNQGKILYLDGEYAEVMWDRGVIFRMKMSELKKVEPVLTLKDGDVFDEKGHFLFSAPNLL